MKLFALLTIALTVTAMSAAQQPAVRKEIVTRNYSKGEPFKHSSNNPQTAAPVSQRAPKMEKGQNPGAITVLNLGTSASLRGYSGGTRTMLWADDDLDVVVNFHTMGPGAAPPALAGYLGMDIGVNMGKTQGDWTNQVQVCAATLPALPDYYDACGFPAAAIYNPNGNTALSDAYLAFFAPNHANLAVPGYGGYSYGTLNLADHADSTKHLRWYNANPYTYLPGGFTVSGNGIVHMVDAAYDFESGVPVYKDSLIYGRGVFNPVTKDFDFTFKSLSFPCKESYGMADCKVAVAPDGTRVWISALTNYAGAVWPNAPLIDSVYYPLLRYSDDCGLNWSEPIRVILDGPIGIDGIKNAYSDYFITNFFVPPWPNRDEIPYTTAFDHSLTVDKWGNPHIGVAVGYTTGGYQIAAGVDSLINVFDIFSQDDGATWYAVRMGSLKTFRGTWGDYVCDNRVYASRDKAGEHVFFTWNDTRVAGVSENQFPDIYARGYDLMNNKLTHYLSEGKPVNVTALSPVEHESFFQCASPFVFTDNSKYTIPLCIQWFSNPAAGADFRYVADFYFKDADFTIPTDVPWWLRCSKDLPIHSVSDINLYPCYPTAISFPQADRFSVTAEPNPASDHVFVTFDLPETESVNIQLMDLFGSVLRSQDAGRMQPGQNAVYIDLAGLPSGVYIVYATIGSQRSALKLLVD